MSEQQIEIKSADGTIDGYLHPAPGGKPRPGVIFLVDIGGIRDSNRELARRVAAEGFTVLQPNPFYRTGRSPLFDFKFSMGEERSMKRLGELATPLTPEAVERDANVLVDFLAAQSSVSAGPMGVVGYCFTGSFAMRFAAARPDKITAAAAFHGGRLYTDSPSSPHLVLPRIKARLYFGHAVKDGSMPEDAINKLGDALASWGGRYENVTYENAYHGWTLSDGPVYNPQQAERAFEKLTELFREQLG